MKLQERPVFRDVVNQEDQQVVDMMSAPAVFDRDNALIARNSVLEMGQEGFKKYPALRYALTLSLYNLLNSFGSCPKKSEAMFRFFHMAEQLIQEEESASDPTNPLPTIGFEVETGERAYSNLKKFPDTGYKPNYKEIFELMGLSNKGNSLPEEWPTSLEFSPPPSYSASVQARILSELIKGGFIPSLKASQKPEDIRQYLGHKSVSFHTNLGIPFNVVRKPQVQGDYFSDIQIFATFLSIAYSSSLRLAHRSSNPFVLIKSGASEMVSTAKSNVETGRVELKGLEVRDESAYRLLHEAQLLGAALFAQYTNIHPQLTILWQEIQQDMITIYQIAKVDNDILSHKDVLSITMDRERVDKKLDEFLKTRGVKVLEDRTLGGPALLRVGLRQYITKRALDIAFLIKQGKAA